MANPFGGSDQALSKNTGHTNQANLVLALVPRTTTKFREVINAADVTTGETGTYDSNGYWWGASATRVDSLYTIPSPFPVGNAHTLICGVITNSPNSTDELQIGLFRNGSTTVRSWFQLNIYGTDVYPSIRDSGFDAGLEEFKNHGAGNNVGFACALAHNGSNAQKGHLRVSGSNVNYTGSSNTNISTASGDNVDRLGVKAVTRYGFQYIFVYNSYLSDADIDAIIDNPAGVVSAAGSSTKPAFYYAQL